MDLPSQDDLKEYLADVWEDRRQRQPGYSLNELGQDLADAIGRTDKGGAPKPWNKVTVSQMLHGAIKIPADAGRAILVLFGRLEGMADVQSRLLPATIYSLSDIPSGTQYGGVVKACVTPGCSNPFIPTSNFQRYCPTCQAARKQKRAVT
jgi:hypothetical protein